MATTDKIKVQCLECGKRFSTRSMLPECPKCGGGDIDLAETCVIDGVRHVI